MILGTDQLIIATIIEGIREMIAVNLILQQVKQEGFRCYRVLRVGTGKDSMQSIVALHQRDEQGLKFESFFLNTDRNRGLMD